MEKKSEEKIEKALLKKAIGFEHNEVIEEYAVGEEGEVKLVKKKVTKKISPPDIPAIKLLLDSLNKDIPISQMSDEELNNEKHRLLQELSNLEKEKHSGD